MWTYFWDWIGTLPQGSASFLGTLAGSTLGLFAILAGALFNAHLNRRRDDALREVTKAYVLTHQYLEGLVLLGGTLQRNMPSSRELVYLDSEHADMVIAINEARAAPVQEAIDALRCYLK
jgi:hypothetical protein